MTKKAKKLAIVEVPANIAMTKETTKALRKAAKKRLGKGYRVIIVNCGLKLRIVETPEKLAA